MSGVNENASDVIPSGVGCEEDVWGREERERRRKGLATRVIKEVQVPSLYQAMESDLKTQSKKVFPA